MSNNGIRDVLGGTYDAITHDGGLALKALGLREDARVLDVGTGAGKFAIYLASQGFHVLTGEPETDTSQYAGQDWAANADRAGVRERIRFEAFDASAMPFETASFDAVFFFGVLHHIDEDVRAAVLREALRVSNPAGGVVFFEPRPETLEALWVDDPDHPLAADPSSYLAGQTVREQRIDGSMMDLFIYQAA